jgi:hypothetical protein
MTKMMEVTAPITYDDDGRKLLSWIVLHLRSNFLFMSLNDDPDTDTTSSLEDICHDDRDKDTSSLEEIARQFEIVEYDPGQIIVEQGTLLYVYCDVFA